MNGAPSSDQPRADAVWLVKDAPPEPVASSPALLLTGAGLVLAIVVCAVLIALLRAHVDRHAPEMAFRRLARRLGVREDARRVLRHLARTHGDMTPTAILLSDEALAEAVRAWAAAGSGGEYRAGVLELLARRGLETSRVPAPRAGPSRARAGRS